MSVLVIDECEHITADEATAILRAYEATWEADDDKNALRRYRRLIRRLSGNRRVTAHHVEHNPMCNPPGCVVLFGRWV